MSQGDRETISSAPCHPFSSSLRLRLGAALFNGDHGRLAEEVARLEAAGLDFIHLDVFDGYFVSDIGFSPRTIAALRPLTRLPFEVHLGVMEPLRFVSHLVDAGADLILVHVESLRMIYEAIAAIREQKVRVGLAVTLGTPVAVLQPIISQLDAVLLLARVTGESARGMGTTFNPLVIPRVRAVREMIAAANTSADLQVAGGVNRHNAAELVAAGATTLAMGAGIYKVPDMAREVAEVHGLVECVRSLM